MDLDYPAKSGATRREHLRQIEESTGVAQPGLESPPIPGAYAEALDLYWVLRSGERLTYAEIVAYSETTGDVVSPVMVVRLREIDAIFHAEIDRKMRSEREQSAAGNRVSNARGHGGHPRTR